MLPSQLNNNVKNMGTLSKHFFFHFQENSNLINFLNFTYDSDPVYASAEKCVLVSVRFGLFICFLLLSFLLGVYCFLLSLCLTFFPFACANLCFDPVSCKLLQRELTAKQSHLPLTASPVTSILRGPQPGVVSHTVSFLSSLRCTKILQSCILFHPLTHQFPLSSDNSPLPTPFTLSISFRVFCTHRISCAFWDLCDILYAHQIRNRSTEDRRR